MPDDKQERKDDQPVNKVRFEPDGQMTLFTEHRPPQQRDFSEHPPIAAFLEGL